jgi:hypothetical protein
MRYGAASFLASATTAAITASGRDTVGFMLHGGVEHGSAGCIDLAGNGTNFFNALLQGAATTGATEVFVTVDYAQPPPGASRR